MIPTSVVSGRVRAVDGPPFAERSLQGDAETGDYVKGYTVGRNRHLTITYEFGREVECDVFPDVGLPVG